MKKKCMDLCERWFVGEITLSKVTLWLACASCLLGGVVYGLHKAPWTHGVMIGSNNGNNCGNTAGNDGEGSEAEENAEE